VGHRAEPTRDSDAFSNGNSNSNCVWVGEKGEQWTRRRAWPRLFRLLVLFSIYKIREPQPAHEEEEEERHQRRARRIASPPR
jgi:hypothetical protein